MIWLSFLTALIGYFYYRKKYHTSFWVGYTMAGTFTFGIYFGLSAVLAFVTSITGLEPFSPTFFYGLLFAALTIGCSLARKSLQVYLDKSVYEANLPQGFPVQGNSVGKLANDNFLASGETIQTNLAGVTFEDRQFLIKRIAEGEPVNLVREPNNPHDDNAIKVLLTKARFGRNDLGYINKDLARRISTILDNSNKPFIEGMVSSIYTLKNDPSITGVKVAFHLPNEQNEDFEDDSPSDLETIIENEDLIAKTNKKVDHVDLGKKSIRLDFDPKLITDVLPEETQALLSLFFSTQGNRWNSSTNWLTGSQVGLWEGIRVQNGHVIGINLSSNGLQGVIPKEIGYLKELQYLLLYDNQLIGTIPPELGSLICLEYLYLYENQLTGSLPIQIGGLINLKEMDIGNNDLSGSLPLTLVNLSNLEYLNYKDTNLVEPNDIRFQDWKYTIESWDGEENFNQSIE